jgi:hypothetical protein
MTTPEKVAKSLLKPINPTVIIVLGLYTIVWGLWIINPFWSMFSQGAVYSAMAAVHIFGIPPEVLFGSIALIAGSIVVRGALKPSFGNIQLGALIGFFHWFTIAILCFMADWQASGGITALTFAIYCGLVWLNIKVNSKVFTK